jgi:uncharacterized protein (TIGR03000 family)
MKRWLAILGTIASVVYFGYVRESEARGLRRCRSLTCLPCPPAACPSPAPPVGLCYDAFGPAGYGTGLMPGTTPAIPPPVPPRTAGKLHALLLVDDANKDTGAANRAGAARLEKLLRDGLPPGRIGTIQTLTGPITADVTRSRLHAVEAGPDDTLLVYYAGAAVYDEAARTYVLTPTAGIGIPRTELRAEMLLQKARLTVLLTDPTAHKVPVEGLVPLPVPPGRAALEGLFFRHRGLIDWNAAAANETAFPRGDEGGLFTLALVRELVGVPDGASWSGLFDAVRSGTDQLFKDLRRAVLQSDMVPDDVKRLYRDQASQTPTALTPFDEVQPGAASGSALLARLSSSPPPATPVIAVAVAPPALPPPALGRPAELAVHLPAGVPLFIEGRPTRQMGEARRFVTPALEPDRVYTYTLRAELPTGPVTRQVQVRAGRVVTVRLGL